MCVGVFFCAGTKRLKEEYERGKKASSIGGGEKMNAYKSTL